MPRMTLYRYRRMQRARARGAFSKWRANAQARRNRRRAKTGVKTGHLKVEQKVLSQDITLPAGPAPTGIVEKLKFEIADIP